MKKPQAGFTIVELLVVIVVIAILAAITIVTYSSVQRRAQATVIRSNLNDAAKQLEMWRIDNGRFPTSTTELSGSAPAIPRSIWSKSPDPYLLVLFCSEAEKFVLAARQANTDQWYMVSSSSGVSEIPSTGLSADGTASCNNMGITGAPRAATWIKAYAGWGYGI